MYTVNSIRNICLLGHSGSGKTALAESLLYMTGAIDRIGKNADGNTVCDYDPEEIRRHISISTSVVPLEYHNVKINLLDTPGAFDFSGAVMEALRAADAAILVCSAKDGITVGFEKAWKYCEDRNMPRFVYISKVDEDNSDYNATFNALREKYGNKIAPVVIPIWNSAHKVTGIIDVLNKRAYEMQNLKRVEIDVPADKVSVIEEFNDALKEAVAETDEALMDRFFEGGDFTYREMITGLHQGVKDLSLFPVLCGSGLTCLGSLMLMDNIIDLLPNPVQGNYHKATTADGKTEEFKERKVYKVLDAIKDEDAILSGKTSKPCAACEATEEHLKDGEYKLILCATKTCPKCAMVTLFLDRAGLTYEKIYAEDNEQFFIDHGIKEAPTLIVVKKDGYEAVANPSNIRKFIDGITQ